MDVLAEAFGRMAKYLDGYRKRHPVYMASSVKPAAEKAQTKTGKATS